MIKKDKIRLLYADYQTVFYNGEINSANVSNTIQEFPEDLYSSLLLVLDTEGGGVSAAIQFIHYLEAWQGKRAIYVSGDAFSSGLEVFLNFPLEKRYCHKASRFWSHNAITALNIENEDWKKAVKKTKNFLIETLTENKDVDSQFKKFRKLPKGFNFYKHFVQDEKVKTYRHLIEWGLIKKENVL